MITEKDVVNRILTDKNLSSSSLDFDEYPLPHPYCPPDKNEIKAIILGADPSNFSDNGKTKKVKYVFDIVNGDKRYFNSINQNLKALGLGLENIYAENLVKNYTDSETDSNPKWEMFADKWLPFIIQELDVFDPNRCIPVLVTSKKIFKYLFNPDIIPGSISDYYNFIKHIPIHSGINKLSRNLIPLSRSYHYSLKIELWERYKNKIIKIVGGNYE